MILILKHIKRKFPFSTAVCFSVLCLVFLCLSLTAQNAQIVPLEYTQQISVTEGLGHSGVTEILEDSKGYLWIATYDGLNRYDGYGVQIFKNTVDKNLLVSNRIRSLAEDANGNLLIGTDEGISLYDYEREQFRDIYPLSSSKKTEKAPIVRNIIAIPGSADFLCMTTHSGIFILKSDYTISEVYEVPKTVSERKVVFFEGLALSATDFAFATNQGLLLFNINTNTFKVEKTAKTNFGRSVVKLSDNRILFSNEKGISVYDYKQEEDSYSFNLIYEGFKNKRINKLTADDRGGVWLGELQEEVIYIHDFQSLLDGRPYKKSIFESEKGTVKMSCLTKANGSGYWLGTFNKGVFRFDMEGSLFSKNKGKDEYGIATKTIIQTEAFDSTSVFLNVRQDDLLLYNTETGKYKDLPFDIGGFAADRLLFIAVDNAKNIWLNFENAGFCYVKAGSRTIQKINHPRISQIDKNQFRSLRRDRNGDIWINCIENIFKLSLDENLAVTKIESLNDNPFFKDNKISLARTLYIDPLFDYIWIGTGANGLYRLDLKSGHNLSEVKVSQFTQKEKAKNSISSNFVTSVVRLPNDEMWIGTERGGICRVLNSEGNLEFVTYSEKDGLSNNVVKAIEYDEDYNLWISTNIGLNKFNTSTEIFRTFGQKDGLSFEDFWYASAKLKNHNLVFTGLNGFLYFDPADLPATEDLPKLEFGDFKLFNQKVNPGDTVTKRVLLKNRLTDSDKINLRHDENVFSIDVKSLHFSAPDNHYIKYQLLPVNENWIEVPSNQQTISYSGLQAGEYTFRVAASNSVNEWTDPKELKITIKPPFGKTIWAYLIYAFLAAGLIYAVFRLVLRFQSLQHAVEIEQLEKDNVTKLNAEKLRFFADISHEIKTPLTLISGPIDILFNRYGNDKDAKDKLSLVRRQAKKIGQLVSQVHDFQRADVNRLKMRHSHFSFDDFIKELVQDFEFMAASDEKTLEVNGGKSEIYVSADRNKLEKILNNLLNNAFKHTNSRDTITINYRAEKEDLILSVEDTGNGVDPLDLPHIFERFYKSQSPKKAFIRGSGIGLAFAKRLVEMHYGYIEVESELDKGTVFKLKLPVVQELTAEQREAQEQKALEAEQDFDKNHLVIERVNFSDIKRDETFAETTIFFAEDNPEMRTFVAKNLSNFFKVKAFNNGQECWEAMKEEWPALVLSDVQMPELSGFELCKKIKTDIKTSHIPVILLTALSALDSQLQGINDGADAYLSKPFDLQHLITRIEALLRNRQQLRERFQIDFPLTLERNDDNAKDSAFLEKLYSLIAENLDNQELELDSFAKQLYLNRTHFYQKVKVLTGQTPFELLKNYRLKKAAEFLVHKKLSVNEVFVMTGFKSRSHFSKLFKEKYEVSPGKYAKTTAEKYNKED